MARIGTEVFIGRGSARMDFLTADGHASSLMEIANAMTPEVGSPLIFRHLH
jgi:hypothetical protein